MGSMKNIFFIFVMAFFIARCESAGSGTPVNIPAVDIRCQTSLCASVASGSYEVTVDFTSSGCAKDQIDDLHYAVGTANITCINGNGCSGTVSSWRDNNGASITQILSSTYSVCGWIDLDPGAKNPNDDFSEQSFLISSSPTITLSTWGAGNYLILPRVK